MPVDVDKRIAKLIHDENLKCVHHRFFVQRDEENTVAPRRVAPDDLLGIVENFGDCSFIRDLLNIRPYTNGRAHNACDCPRIHQ